MTDHGGKILYDTTVTNIVRDCNLEKKVAKKESTQGGVEKVIDLTENDLVICTNGCQGRRSATWSPI
ncbi:MAG: oleate hydratase [Subdoligranulum sp.]